jgi:hypothetical protein
MALDETLLISLRSTYYTFNILRFTYHGYTPVCT